ncbi:TatD family hydrolase [Xanthomonadaceae bacterium XH05]|nr:TatD family hydrolase [Xanthomonadaceae bacterium XH05]
MYLVDSHCHIDAPEFDADRDAAILRARQAGVAHIIAPAVDAASWPTLRDVSLRHPNVLPAYGLHPMYLANHHPDHLALLHEWIARERPVAVGECGLDHFIGDLDPARQCDFLIGQLKLARTFDLPVILHARRALDDVMALLRRIGGLRGVVHSFSGSAQQADALFRMGFLLGIGGPATYERARRLRGIVRTMPIESLLLETDAPDQPDSAIRGQRNEPERLSVIAQMVAELRDAPVETIAAQTSANAARLFRLGPIPADA